MNNDLKNILTKLNKDVAQEKLLQYLNKEMSDSEQHDLEKNMEGDAFAEDALEGLHQLDEKKKIPLVVEQLNLHLKKEVSKRNTRKKRRDINQQPWVYYAIILVLLLAIVTFLVIKKM